MNDKILVVLVNYNGYGDTIETIESLQQCSTTVKIVVVDNASNNDEGPRIAEKYSDVKVICSDQNLGFSGGNNIGIQYALKNDYEYIVLLNNDTIVDKNIFSELRKNADEHTVSVPSMYYYDEPDRIWYGGGTLSKITGNATHIDMNVTDNEKAYITPTECTFATGCCVMLHRQVVEQIGLLGEEYFMYCEDTDYCIRLAQKQIRIMYVPAAKLWHKISRSTGGSESSFSIYYMTRNRLNYIKKYKDYFSWVAYPYSLITRYIRMIQFRLQKKEEWKAFRKAIKDHKRSCWGKVSDVM